MLRYLILALAIVAAWPLSAGAQPAPESASAAHVKLPDGPASVRGLGGDVEVGIFSGQVSYGVGFDLPAGRAGLTPSLGISYSGELGNGPVGVGWGLSHPAIRRSTRHGVPAFTAADELELDGSRLVSIGGDQYRVEGAGNGSRIVGENNRFVVTDSDGVRTYFGLTAASRQQDSSGRTFAWLPELTVHPSGAAAFYHYRHEGGQIYLEQITWGPDRRFEVVLDWQLRPDPVTSYREGFKVVTGLRLATVRVRSTETELRAYHLSYDDSHSLTRLAGVEMTGFQGQGALPEVTFGYAAPEPPGLQQLSGTEGWHLESRGVMFFDVDGDGADDLYRAEIGNHEYRKNLGGAFGPRTALPGATGLDLSQVALIDLDGDARPELVRLVNDSWRYSRLESGTWQSIGTWPGTRNLPLPGPGVAHADLDGDGRTDVLEDVTGGVRVTFGGAAGMQAPQTLPAINPGQPWIVPGAANVRIVDVNGDGLADAVFVGETFMTVMLGRGDGTFAAHRRVFYPWSGQSVDPRHLKLVDLDRDGLLDLVRFTAGHVLYFRGRADGSLEPAPRHISRPESAEADVTVAVTDANGNGSADIVWSSPRGMWILDLAGATTAGMLERIENGLGQITRFEYQSSAALAIASELSGEPWTRKLPVSVPVPTTVRIDAGSGPERVVLRGVRDGFWDGAERRFGGFLEGRQSLPADTAAGVQVERTSFHPGEGDERVLRGQPISAQTQDAFGTVLSRVYTQNIAQPVGGLPSHPLLRVPITKLIRTFHHEGVAEPIETLTWFTHDDQGRVTEEHVEGRLDLEGDESVKRTTWADDNTTSWIRDRVCEVRLESASAEVISRARTYFGGPTGSLEPLCQVGLGLERQVEGWLEGAATPWIVQSWVNYTAGWNPATVYADGVTRTLTYDADDLYVIGESITPQAGTTLSWTLDWDEVRGLPETLTDPSGVVTTVTHDELGRLATVAEGSSDPHVHHVYDWTAPYPTTTTFTFDKSVAQLGTFSGSFAEGSGWRQMVTVANGAGEARFSATRLADDEWAVSGWTERDRRGRPIRAADAFFWPAADVRPAAPPMGTPEQTIIYDAFDRVVEQELPTGAKQSVEYIAFREIHSGDDLAPVTTDFDGQGRITRTERTVDMVTESVDATYDPAGRLTAMCLQGDTQTPCTMQSGTVTHAFSYDTLGRLTFATDPDIGDRELRYNDANFLVEHENAEGEIVELVYDGAGRLVGQSGDGGSFAFHYDETQAQTTAGRVLGRLAWVEEPTGIVELAYDAFGRRESLTRSINSLSATETLTYSPSGLILSSAHDANFTAVMSYDDGGRLVAIDHDTTNLWQVLDQDAAGRILVEQFGNGVEQTTDRDELGQPDRVQIIDTTRSGACQYQSPNDARCLYDVVLSRNAYGAITTVADSDGAGLDHSATFTYDDAARLTGSTLAGGAGSGGYTFGYQYDGLQNMIDRSASGPTALGALVGTYRYAESGAGPRQLTSVLKPDSSVHAFSYDLAGRQITDGASTLTYNGLDQLVAVQPPTGNPVTYSYGYDGLRVLTTHPDGTEERWFAESLRQLGAERHHYVRNGAKTIARVTMLDTSAGGGSLAPPPPPPPPSSASRSWHRAAPTAIAFALLALLAAMLRRRSRWSLAPAAAALLAFGSCGLFGSGQKSVWVHQQTLYFHHGVAPGPVVMTRDDATVFSERRYEPFGQPIDDFQEEPLPGTGTQTGPIDFLDEPLNSLNKPTDPTTGFSYHGARWMASTTARWLTPDPPVKAPDPKFMAEPWGLHPYQYVEQNPVQYWDPDGRQKKRVRLTVVDVSGALSTSERASVADEAGRSLNHTTSQSRDRVVRQGVQVEATAPIFLQTADWLPPIDTLKHTVSKLKARGDIIVYAISPTSDSERKELVRRVLEAEGLSGRKLDESSNYISSDLRSQHINDTRTDTAWVNLAHNPGRKLANRIAIAGDIIHEGIGHRAIRLPPPRSYHSGSGVMTEAIHTERTRRQIRFRRDESADVNKWLKLWSEGRAPEQLND
jgi:RHS repeat-associated protein